MRMKRTTTSAFGTGKREAQYASAFYNRSLYNGLGQPAATRSAMTMEIPVVFAKPAFSRSDRGVSDRACDKLMEGTLSGWDIPTEIEESRQLMIQVVAQKRPSMAEDRTRRIGRPSLFH